jgi:hypothetical protein
MADKKLIEFIKEARKRGFGDLDIKRALLNHGWNLEKVEKAFAFFAPKYKRKNQVTLFLSTEVMDALEKRAKKNMFTVSEQIQDILRRSTVNQRKKKSIYDERLDDALVAIFSRKKTGRKPKKKAKKKKKKKK